VKRLALILAFLACSCAWAQVDDGYTTSLLHFDGDFADEAGLTWTGFSGAVATSTDSKFGGSSLYLDGASWLAASSSAGLDFGAGSFTVDWWERRTSSSPGGTVFARDGGIQYSPVLCGYEYLGNVVFWATTASSWDISGGEVMGVASTSWVHRAVVRDGSTFYLFENGTQTTTFSSAGAIAASTADAAIGVYFASNYFVGYIDEFRISKGVARWTSAFTPPTEAYGPATPTAVTPGRLAFAGDYDRPVSDAAIIALAHFDSGFGDELAGTWTASGTVTATSTARFGNAMDCNTGEILSPSISSMAVGLGDFTLEFWIYFPTALLTSQMQGVFAPVSGDFFKCDGRLRAGGGPTQYLDFTLGFGGTTFGTVSISGGSELQGWNHLALCRGSGTLRFFVNGTLEYAAADANAVTTEQVSLGRRSFLGSIANRAYFDEVRISTDAKYTSAFSVPSAAFSYSPEYIAVTRRLLAGPGGKLLFGGAP
jgi:hypothetical protein